MERILGYWYKKSLLYKIKIYTKGLRLALDKIRITTIVNSENTASPVLPGRSLKRRAGLGFRMKRTIRRVHPSWVLFTENGSTAVTVVTSHELG
jgi:hypothetical protein